MSDPRHSPTPWIVKETGYGIKHIYSARDDEGYMTSIGAIFNSGPETRYYDEELIRHAPNLLAAIKEVLALVGHDKLRTLSDEEHANLSASLSIVARLAEGRQL